MGLFVVARLAARHGIRVRLRPASMGGLTALVWLPDEVIAHEPTGFTAGLRRLDATEFAGPAPGGPELNNLVLDRAGTDGGPWAAGGRRHAMGQRPAADEREPLGAVTPVQEEAPVLGARGAPGTVGVIVPPTVSTGTENRLPIFESVESDWFRRTRQGADAPAAAGSAEPWSTPADEGWRAAEVARSPVSEGVTAAGLPQRVPRANLVPGRVAPAAAVAPPAPARSAAQTQQRLASFQRAVRDARAATRSTGGTGTNGAGSPGTGENGTGENGTGENGTSGAWTFGGTGTNGTGTGGAPAGEDGGQPD
jgi:hypothetical protein